MTTPRCRVAIVGGGMAALATAAELLREPGAAERFEITIYQLGWRLGGKGASGRNLAPGVGKRIEEHGLHVWFGCYDHAWSLLQRCYALLGRGPDMLKLFQGQTDTPYMEDVNGWKVWPVSFPRKFGALGEHTAAQDVLGWLRAIVRYVEDLGRRLHGHAQRAGDNPRHQGFLARLLGDVGEVARTITAHVAAVAELVEAVAAGAAGREPDADIAAAVEALRALLMGRQVDIADLDDELRRDAIMADLALTALGGMLRDDVLRRGFDPLDREDARAWFRRHGAHETTLTSAPIRALYDLCFAYRGGAVSWANADFAAGAALVTVLRIALEYPDYVVYEMRAGMGEVVIAPIYRALLQQGVKFRFFHRAAKLELAADARSVAAVHVELQATVKGGADYRPTFTLPFPGLDPDRLECWPSEPLYEQLDQGEQLRGVNLESRWGGWQPVGRLELRAGADFDLLVLGASLAEARELCADFAGRVPGWSAMFDAMRTVPTVGTQLWMNRPLEDLGWPHGPVPIDAGPEPLDVWADRSDVLQRESWGDPAAGPRSLHYLCGPLDEGFAAGRPPGGPGYLQAAQDAAVRTTRDWLVAHAGALWPNATVRGAGFDWELLWSWSAQPYDDGPARLQSQYIRANVEPTERYVLSVAGSTATRLRAGGSGLANLVLAGDWIRGRWNAGCIEAATMSGQDAAQALRTLAGACGG
jgi:uncharacterized protein with NAD-binding domain and iron-sulfur cluster